MTAQDLAILAGSGLGVAVLVAIAWLMGFSARAPVADRARIAAAIAAVEPGAIICDLVQDAGGRGALALLADGRFAAVTGVADGLSVRVFSPAALAKASLKRTRAGAVLRLAFRDVGFPGLTLACAGAEPPAWAAGLGRRDQKD